jgi:peptide/nickel transport system permease protein
VKAARRAGAALLVCVAAATLAAPWIAPNPSNMQFADRALAPPSRVRIRDAHGFRRPFVYRQVLVDRLARTYQDDPTHPEPLVWFTGGRLVSVGAAAQPLLLFGADGLGRDVYARLIHGARLSLGVTALGVLGAIVIGVLVGGLAGAVGGRVDLGLMLVADFLIVLPGAYLVLVLRGLLPLVLEWQQVFGWMALLLAIAAWPHVARGVRAVVAAERTREYVEAARASGAGPWRLLRHFLPATRGFLVVEIVLLAPALLIAEATLSLLGLGFAEPESSWGTMLYDAQNVRLMAEAPWLLAPAAALFVVVLGLNLIGASIGAEAGVVPPSRNPELLPTGR